MEMPLLFMDSMLTVNIFSNFGDTGSSTYYIDAIRGAANGAAVGSDPGTDPDPDPDTDPDPVVDPLTVAAPTPNKAPADVISVYSDAYTSNATEIDPFWGQTTDATEIQIDGNNTLKYANLNYQGLQYPETDVSAMEFLHLDYYTDEASFDFSLISTGPLENAYTITTVTGSWQSIDIPLTAYTVPELDRVFQFKTAGNGTVYLDNLYFWKAPAAAGTDSSLSALTVDGSSIADFGAFEKKLFCGIASRNNGCSNSCGNDNRHKCKRCRNGCNKHSWNNNYCCYGTRWNNNDHVFNSFYIGSYKQRCRPNTEPRQCRCHLCVQ